MTYNVFRGTLNLALSVYHLTLISLNASCESNKVTLFVVSSPDAGNWLYAPTITAVGLRLSDEAIKVAVAHRLGCKASEPHTCICGKAVNARGLHGLSCRKSAPRQHRHSQLNDIIWRPIKRAQIPAVKEPVSLMWDDIGPDGTTLFQWYVHSETSGLGYNSTRHTCGLTHA